ncbi:MAG: hypothetical protein ACRD0G_11095 [Acidimicrobiales bacterium]
MADDYTFRWEAPVDEVFHPLHDAQSAWLSAIDSLTAPDRRTHELIRLVCQVIAQNPGGIERHARLAGEVGCSWEDVLGAVLLTQPAFGVLPATHAFDPARRGWEAGASAGGE